MHSRLLRGLQGARALDSGGLPSSSEWPSESVASARTHFFLFFASVLLCSCAGLLACAAPGASAGPSARPWRSAMRKEEAMEPERVGGKRWCDAVLGINISPPYRTAHYQAMCSVTPVL